MNTKKAKSICKQNNIHIDDILRGISAIDFVHMDNECFTELVKNIVLGFRFFYKILYIDNDRNETLIIETRYFAEALSKYRTLNSNNNIWLVKYSYKSDYKVIWCKEVGMFINI